MRFWTPAELAVFLTAAAEDERFPLYRLTGMTGLRRGEVCGLRWANVDLDAATVAVLRRHRADPEGRSAGDPFHDLRHSHCAHLIAAGRNPREISQRLGHASVSFTLDRYGHLMPEAGAEAAAAVAALVDGQQSNRLS